MVQRKLEYTFVGRNIFWQLGWAVRCSCAVGNYRAWGFQNPMTYETRARTTSYHTLGFGKKPIHSKLWASYNMLYAIFIALHYITYDTLYYLILYDTILQYTRLVLYFIILYHYHILCSCLLHYTVLCYKTCVDFQSG